MTEIRVNLPLFRWERLRLSAIIASPSLGPTERKALMGLENMLDALYDELDAKGEAVVYGTEWADDYRELADIMDEIHNEIMQCARIEAETGIKLGQVGRGQ